MENCVAPKTLECIEKISKAKEEVEAYKRQLEYYETKYTDVEKYAADSNSALRNFTKDELRRIEYLKTEYAKSLSEYERLSSGLLSLSSYLSHEEYQVIIMHHIENKTFQEIAKDLNFSERTIYRYYKSAMEELEKYSCLL